MKFKALGFTVLCSISLLMGGLASAQTCPPSVPAGGTPDMGNCGPSHTCNQFGFTLAHGIDMPVLIEVYDASQVSCGPCAQGQCEVRGGTQFDQVLLNLTGAPILASGTMPVSTDPQSISISGTPTLGVDYLTIAFVQTASGGVKMSCTTSQITTCPTCGDSTIEGGETCDDGNTVSGDGCSSTCSNEGPLNLCNDGILQVASEACDYNNGSPIFAMCAASGYTCDSNCEITQINNCTEGTERGKPVGNEGDACDDGDANTFNDVLDATGCTCIGGPASIDGVCGAADGVATATTPTDLCATGTANPATAMLNTTTNEYEWSCNGSGGGVNVSCAAPQTMDGVCGTMYDTCGTGTAGNQNDTACSEDDTWDCAGINGGATVLCSVPDPCAAVDGVCGPADTVAIGTAPTGSSLCALGDPNPDPAILNGLTNTYEWSCDGEFGGTNDACSAPRIVLGICGTDDSTTTETAPTGVTMCTEGTANPDPASVNVATNMFEWICEGENGGADDVCSADQTTDGLCGSTRDTCAIGSVTNADDTVCGEDDTWDCTGVNGGATVSCSIPESCTPENGTCGSANGVTVTSTPDGMLLCATGVASPNPAMVNAAGDTYEWTCDGTGGGTTESCSAPKADNGVCGSVYSTCTTGTAVNQNDTACGMEDTWDCEGVNGGSTISCSVQETCEDGVCGSADTIATETAPTGGDLCDAGSSDVFSAVLNTVTNEYEWMCLGAGVDDACSAPVILDGVCGTNFNTCDTGSETNENDTECGMNDTWDCSGVNGGATVSCLLEDSCDPVDGTCGSVQGTSVYDADAGGDMLTNTSADLCENGVLDMASFAYDAMTNEWTWTCDGTSGGTGESCLATESYCGDLATKSPEEVCDDGANGDDADGCTDTCMLGSICGDGMIQMPNDAGTGGANNDGMEACDDGSENSDTLADACRTTCVPAMCGDGVIDAGEACDDGNTDENDGCRNDCTMNVCGDGVINVLTEACDDGNTDDTDGCYGVGSTAGTPCSLTSCGDTITQMPNGEMMIEQCDDDNGVNEDLCLNTCMQTSCGDGFIQSPNADGISESCDDGPLNSDAVPGACRLSCQPASCGDNVVDPGEVCDDGNMINGDGCNAVCEVEVCGDAQVNNNGTEACDDGNDVNGDGCTDTCEVESCGDGYEDLDGANNSIGDADDEGCDDGNAVNGDGCTDACEVEICGDGEINNAGTEACDDGNLSNGDGCSGACVIEACRDGFINNNGSEACDDGNAVNGDGCTDACVKEFCGDGEVNNNGAEACDDGANGDDSDGCTDTCLVSMCATNGFVYFDADRNDLYDASADVELAGVQVSLSNGMTTTTNADGYYEFVNHACEQMMVSYTNNTGFIVSSAQLENTTQQSDPMEIVIGSQYYDTVSDNNNFGLISNGSGGGGSVSRPSRDIETVSEIVPDIAPEVIEKNEEQEVEEIVEPIVEAIEIIEPVIKPIVEVLELESGAELMEQAKGKQWRMVLAEQDLVVPEEYQTTEEILQYLEFISANYLVVNNLPQLAKDASISGITPLALPVVLPKTGAQI